MIQKMSGRLLAKSNQYQDGVRSKTMEICETTHFDGGKTYAIKIKCELTDGSGSTNMIYGMTAKDINTLKQLMRNL